MIRCPQPDIYISTSKPTKELLPDDGQGKVDKITGKPSTFKTASQKMKF
jgi:hypothetical protein